MFCKPLATTSAMLFAAAVSIAIAATPDSPGVMNPDTDKPGLPVGAKAPDATLQTIDGKEVTLASLYADGPVIVTFYRGGWCPFCTKALAGWEGRMDEVEAIGATFVAVTPESPDNAASTGAKHAPSMTILSDPHHEASRNYHLSFNLPEDVKTKYKGYGIDLEKSNASHNWELPAPGTFVIDRDGTIVYAWADWDYKKRADPDEVLKAAKEAAK